MKPAGLAQTGCIQNETSSNLIVDLDLLLMIILLRTVQPVYYLWIYSVLPSTSLWTREC